MEKIVQHSFVSLAFYFYWNEIAATVVVDTRNLLILGAIVPILFGCAL